MLAETLAWGTLCLLLISPPVLSFGMLRPGAEHERITRAALACPPGKKTTGDCFEPLSMDQLAGKNSIVGAVDSPDAGSNLNPLAHCDDADYIDYPRYGIPGTYPRTPAQATRALQDCVAHLSGQFHKGIARAKGLLDDKNNIIKRKTDVSTRRCRFVGGFRGRAKCNAMEGLGRALHGVQDFYTHSNWVDEHDKTKPISASNPPGLGLSAPAPLLNLRGVTSPKVPPELATGCFIAMTSGSTGGLTFGLTGQTECIAQGRLLTHAALNKDEGTINEVLGVSIPPPSPLTSAPHTPRGRIARNFELAVQAAIADTRRQWSDFRAQLVSEYGPKRASRMICALVSDHPWKDCTGRKIALVIDSSGSNKETDPGDLRIAAAQAFTATLVTEAAAGPDNFPDLVTVIDFDDSARVIYPLGDPASVSFNGIDSVGGTIIGIGVSLAIDEVASDTTGETQDHAGIIVFTDFQDNNPSALVAAHDLAYRLGIRVSFGFLSPPPKPVPRPSRRRSNQSRNRALYPRQSDATPPTELLEAVLKTGGVFSTIDSAEAQQSFVELVIARGPTNIDSIGTNNGGPLFQGVTVYGLSSAAREPDIFTYHATPGQNLKFEIQAVTGPALNVPLNDVRGSQELAKVVTDDQGRGTIVYEASADVDLQLIISTTVDAGDATGLYSVKLVVAPPDEGPHSSDTCDTPNGFPCQPLGERKCCGTGFLICDHGGTIFLDCGPGTVCKSDNGTDVYCRWP
ncbi:hypothetical protein FOCG_10333 [Fusarium oxysporum f. sp. radicis-lycopersici 26381]|nr:hypothetical protein FOCG_10333 [Fusarium oxysporum f. sp. radicis-lycopersici 26381]